MIKTKKRKTKYRIIPVIVGILSAGFVVSVLFASTKDIANFIPSGGATSSNNSSIATSQESFDSSQTGNQGLAADENTENSKSLDQGDEQMIQNQSNSGSGLAVSSGTSNSSGISGLTGSINGSGNTVIIGNGGSSSGNGNGDSSIIGTGINTGTSYVHSGEIAYGDDASPEVGAVNATLESFYRSNAEIASLTCNSAPNIYLCPGEQPDSDYISEALNVTISTMIPGSTRRFPQISGTKYIYKNDIESYKGDYIIDWDNSETGIQNKAPTALGSYNATVYGYNPVTGKKTSEGESTFLYNVIDYRVSLLDFSEDFAGAGAGEEQLIQTVHASGNRVCDLTQAKANLNDRILARTSSTRAYKYIYQNSSGKYEGYFSGWAVTSTITGANSYVVSRPASSADVKVDRTTRQRYYEQTLVPIWIDSKVEDEGFNITLNSEGEIILDGYKGTASAVKTIDIPEGVTVLDLKTFGNKVYDNLTLINIPDTVIKIIFPDDMSSFPALTDFGVADNNQNFLDINGILYNKSGKQLIKVPPATKAISKWSDRVTEVGPYAFAGVNIKDSIELPSTVSAIDDKGFENCNIDSLVITNDNVSFGIDAFSTGDKSKLSVRKIVVNSSEYDKIYLNELNKLIKSLYDSGYDAHGTLATTTLVDSSGLENKYTLENDLILTSDKTTLVGVSILCDKAAVIPSSVTTINDNALKSETLKDVYFQNENTAVPLRASAFGGTIPDNLRIHVPSNSFNYVYQRSWSGARGTLGSDAFDAYVLPYGEGVTTDEDGGVYYENVLIDGRNINGAYAVAAGTREIKAGAFKNNINVTRVTLNADMTRINNRAFENCSGLTSVTVGGTNLAYIGNRAFYFCNNLNQFVWSTLDSTMKLHDIGEYAFYSTALTGLPSRIGRTAIGDLRDTLNLPSEDISAFNSCVIFEGQYTDGDGNVKTAFANLKYIGNYVFGECQKYIYLSIPKSIDISTSENWYKYITDNIEPNWFVICKDIYPVGNSYGTISTQGGSGGSGGGDSGGEII